MVNGTKDDDDCFYYHSWRNNVVIAFGTLSSLLLSGIEYKKQDVTAGCTWPCRARTFEAFSTASDKHQVLQMADVFSYNVKDFKPLWRDLVGLLKEVDSDQRFVKNKLSRKKSCLICRQLLQSFYHTKMGSPITGVYPIFENGVPMRGLSDFLTRYRGFIEDDYRR